MGQKISALVPATIVYDLEFANGRKRSVNSLIFFCSERPLLRKADIQISMLKNLYAKGRFAPGSSRWARMAVKGCL